MRDEPSGPALLDIAHRTLMADIVPSLNGRQRYAALMVANAMRIAAREQQVAARCGSARDAVLEFVAGEMDSGDPASALGRQIREGRFDGDAALYDALRDDAVIAAGTWKPSLLSPAERTETGLLHDADQQT